MNPQNTPTPESTPSSTRSSTESLPEGISRALAPRLQCRTDLDGDKLVYTVRWNNRPEIEATLIVELPPFAYDKAVENLKDVYESRRVEWPVEEKTIITPDEL